MDAVEFLNEWKRMCKSFEMCEDCVGEKYCYNPKETTPDCSNNWGETGSNCRRIEQRTSQKDKVAGFFREISKCTVENWYSYS